MISQFHMAGIAAAVSRSLGIEIKLHKGSPPKWGADPEKSLLVIPAKKAYTDGDVGALIHEAGHVAYSQHVTLSDPRQGVLLNALEDVRIEEKLARRYPGLAHFMGASYGKRKTVDDTPHMQLLAAIVTGRWGDDPLGSLPDDFPENWQEIVEGCKNTQEVFDWMNRELWPKYGPLFPPIDPSNPGTSCSDRKIMDGDEIEREGGSVSSIDGATKEDGKHWRNKTKERPIPVKMPPGLSRRVRAVLGKIKDDLARREVHGLSSGKVSGQKLHKLVTKTSAAIFRKAIDKKSSLPALSILVDVSGSMAGDKLVTAALSTRALYEAAHGLGMPTEILTFNRWVEPVLVFGKTIRPALVANRIYGAIKNGGSDDNCDGEAVLIAARRLKERPEHKKILLVLSDGSPCQHSSADTILSTALIKSLGVPCFGIGIEDRSAESYYPNHRIINNANDLPEVMLDVLRMSIYA